MATLRINANATTFRAHARSGLRTTSFNPGCSRLRSVEAARFQRGRLLVTAQKKPSGGKDSPPRRRRLLRFLDGILGRGKKDEAPKLPEVNPAQLQQQAEAKMQQAQAEAQAQMEQAQAQVQAKVQEAKAQVQTPPTPVAPPPPPPPPPAPTTSKSTSTGGVERLLANNNEWAAAVSAHDPNFFPQLAKGQAPEFLWIGCSDSRVVPNLATGTNLGDVFTHRNVGNIVMHSDANCMSAIEFSVHALGVQHVIVCGHYGCGAVNAAMTLPQKSDGVTNCWIASIRDVRNYYAKELSKLDRQAQLDFVCEANAVRQAFNVCTAPPIQSAWEKGMDVQVHAVIFDLATGKLTRLAGPFSSLEQATKAEATQFKQLSEKISKDLTDVLKFEKAMV